MKTFVTYDSYYYYFETLINNNHHDYFMMCQALQADGYTMVNNGWVEDGEEFTVYRKKIAMDL